MRIEFIESQRRTQADYFNGAVTGHAGYRGCLYRLDPLNRPLNFQESIRTTAVDYFDQHKITWHRHASHGLSSQACCLNFLMPLATRPEALAAVIGGALESSPLEMLPVEAGPLGQPWFVGFEWTGKANYLGEWPEKGSATRGANATSADAIVRFQHAGMIETLLIEWKYTERYGAPIPSAGNRTRVVRYADKAFAPDGPIRADLGLGLKDFLCEPFYQLLRSQMLAFQMQKAREDGADRVRVLHLSPGANHALHKVTAPTLHRFGADAFDVFASVLVEPAAFISRSIEQTFGPLLSATAGDPWSKYLTARYSFLRGGAI